MNSEAVEDKEKIQRIKVKMVKIPKEFQGRSSSSTDPEVTQEEGLWEGVEIIEPEDIVRKIVKFSEKLDIAEAKLKSEFDSIIEVREATMEEYLKYMGELHMIQAQRTELWKQSYEDEKMFRHEADERVARWRNFLKDARLLHPKGAEENIKAEQSEGGAERRTVKVKEAPSSGSGQVVSQPKRMKAPPPDLDEPIRGAVEVVQQKEPPRMKAPPTTAPSPPTVTVKEVSPSQPKVKKPPPPIAPSESGKGEGRTNIPTTTVMTKSASEEAPSPPKMTQGPMTPPPKFTQGQMSPPLKLTRKNDTARTSEDTRANESTATEGTTRTITTMVSWTKGRSKSTKPKH